jgi:hypothetical protein
MADIILERRVRDCFVRARITRKEKEQLAQFAKKAKVKESDVIRYALQKAGILR